MAIIEIQNRWTGAVLYSGEHADVKRAIEAAVKADADLADADLTGACLARADLTGACLTGAYLAGATLADADLTRATLADAHGEGEQANIHAQHYLEALAFAKRLLIDQAGEKL